MEEWRPVKGYEGRYEVSDLGRVRSLPKYNLYTTRIMRQALNSKGRFSVMLRRNEHEAKRIEVHRLVAMAFVDNPDPERFKEVNHKDENPKNNRADNLEWCDRWYNMHYNNLPKRIHKPNEIGVIGRDVNGKSIYFKSLRDADRGGFCRGVLKNIFSGKRQETFYKGYFWEVANGN